jgi:aminoglycoside phosphotransferase (APT) family kinase protein
MHALFLRAHPFGIQQSLPMNSSDKSVGVVVIDVALVARLIASQFPQWAGLSISPVDLQGNDNRNFRLGDTMSVRLPSARWYASGIEKEQTWLPRLAPQLPLPIPVPLAKGKPDEEYPWAWSVYRWLDGEIAQVAPVADLRAFATSLAGFLRALEGIDARDGPPAGLHSFHRGATLSVYDEQTRSAIAGLGDRIDKAGATAVWEEALATRWRERPVWFHGDVSIGNLLVKNGGLSAVIDFDVCGVGDPACDLTIAWTFFDAGAREALRAGLPLDAGTWARGRGWALWKALIGLAQQLARSPGAEKRTIWTHNPTTGRCIVDEVIADHRRE